MRKLVQSGRLLPSRAYHKGLGQITSFLTLSGHEAPEVRADRSTVTWLNRYAENELAGAMGRYADQIRSAILYGLKHEANPSQTALWLYRATRDAREDWRLIARTETARANTLGRLHGVKQSGYDRVWVPPHAGGCEACRTLLFNKVFPVEQLYSATNYKRKRSEWVPALPLHPRCRCAALPYIESIHEAAQDEYARLGEWGLDDDTLEEMFDSGGHLKPQYENDPRLTEFFAGKTITDPYMHVLGEVVAKQAKACQVAKGFFDPPHRGLDPLLWDEDRLNPDARAAILDFWTSILGDGWEQWGTVYITGSATSYQWGTGYAHPWLGPKQTLIAPDVDTHLLIDYEHLFEQRPLWRDMASTDVRVMLEAWVNRAKQDVEVMPGVRLDAYIRLEPTQKEFLQDVECTGQGVYDVNSDSWIARPTRQETGEHFGQRPLAGLGGHLAIEHPDWLAGAEDAGRELQRLLDSYTADRSTENRQALQSCMDVLYDSRSEGFRDGEGQASRGNFTWAFLENFGSLVDVKQALHAS